VLRIHAGMGKRGLLEVWMFCFPGAAVGAAENSRWGGGGDGGGERPVPLLPITSCISPSSVVLLRTHHCINVSRCSTEFYVLATRMTTYVSRVQSL